MRRNTFFLNFLLDLFRSLFTWNKIFNLNFSGNFHYLHFAFCFSEILREGNRESLGEENSVRGNESAMRLIIFIEFVDLFWWAFGQLPERFSFFCLHINRISEKKLSDVVSIVNVEFANRFCNTVIKAFGKIFDHLSHCLLFLSFQSIKIFRLYYFFQGFRIESKYLAEDISSPLNTMDSLFGEHLQCTVRNLSFFVWIILASVVFGFERHNNLNMAFWS